MTSEETYTPGDVVVVAWPTGDDDAPFVAVEARVADPVRASRNRIRVTSPLTRKVHAFPADHIRPTDTPKGP